MRDALDLRLDPRRSLPLYGQIVEQVRTRIASGVLPAGYRLPPTRDLARRLKTHRNTVVRAYEELAASGHTVSTVGRGTFVTEPPAAKRQAAPPSRAPLPWDSLVSQRVLAEPIRRAQRVARQPLRKGTIDLAGHQPPAELIPHAALRRCIDHVLREVGPSALGYVQDQGLPRLREQVALDLAKRGVPADPDDLVITTGSQQALDILARLLVDPGDEFLVESSTYGGAIHLLTVAGARIVGVPSDDEGPDLDAARQLSRGRPKGFYLMPNHHNPTGGSISRRRREALLAWSHEAGVPLVEDDYDADLELDGQPAPRRLRAMSADVFHVGTYSKKLIPALRVGYLVCPRAVLPKVVALKTDQDLGTSGLLQHALAEFLARGYLGAHVDKTAREYRARRDTLEEALREALPAEITWRHPERGLFLWLPLPPDVSSEAVHEEARRRGVMVMPGLLHRVSEGSAHGIRVSFCRERPARLVEGAARLGEALRAVMAARDAALAAPGPRLGATT